MAPAHRAAAGPTTTTPFSSRSGPIIDSARRASIPTDTLQLYYPMTLQPFDHGVSSTRQMVSMTRSLSSSHATVGSLSATANHHHPYDSSSYASNRLSYSGTLHPHAQSSGNSSGGGGSGAYLSVPMSAPAISNPNPFLGSQPHQQQSLYSNSTQPTSQNSPYMHSPSHSTSSSGGRVLTPHEERDYQSQSSSRYSFPDHHSSSPQPGSGFGTPQ